MALENAYFDKPTLTEEISIDPVLSELLMTITDIEIDVLGNVPAGQGTGPQSQTDKITTIRNVIMDATSRLRLIRQKTRLLN